MADLTTTYMGISLRNPLIVGASPLTANLESIKEIEEMGAGALVTRSLFEEQIQLERHEFDKALHKEDNRYAEMITVTPNLEYDKPIEHLAWVKKAKEAVSIPVFASLNAVNTETWLEYATLLEQTGVDGLECNLFATPKDQQPEGSTVELEQIALIEELAAKVSIPISVKLSYFYTNPLNVIQRMDKAGAAAFVLFNRLFEPDIDSTKECLTFPFNPSQKQDYRLPLRYAGLLEGQISADICSSSGIMSGHDIAKMILAGATTVQTVSTLLQHKVSYIKRLLADLEQWMEAHEYNALSEFRGSLSRRHNTDPWAYTRSQYIKLMMSPQVINKPSSRKD